LLELNDELKRALLSDQALMEEIREQVTLELAQIGCFDGLCSTGDGIFDAAFMQEIGSQANLLYLEQVSASLPKPRGLMYVQPAVSPQRWDTEQRKQRPLGGLLMPVLSLAALVICLCVLTSMLGGGSSSSIGRGLHQITSRTSVVPASTVSVPASLLKKYNNPYVITAWRAAVSHHINPVYFLRQINQESGFDSSAISPAGAIGIAQFMPGTAAGMGIDPWDPTQALNGAALYMERRLNEYGGNYAKALVSYNGGDGAVQNAVATCGTKWFNCVPSESHHYVCVILNMC